MIQPGDEESFAFDPPEAVVSNVMTGKPADNRRSNRMSVALANTGDPSLSIPTDDKDVMDFLEQAEVSAEPEERKTAVSSAPLNRAVTTSLAASSKDLLMGLGNKAPAQGMSGSKAEQTDIFDKSIVTGEMATALPNRAVNQMPSEDMSVIQANQTNFIN